MTAPDPSTPPCTGPLDGVRVLDMTAVGMGPLATQILGDMGADVIKVETAAGDIFRHVTPQRHQGMSHAALNFNRNKRSIVLDARTAHGQEAMRRLLARADVFVSNVRAQGMRRLGLDYATLAPRHPRLVYCACYGFGEGGPYAGRPAVDDVIQATCGLAAIQGTGGEAPRYVQSVVVDKIMGMQVAQSIAMALYAREKTGRGQFIEAPMFETMVAFMAAEHLGGLTFVPPIGGSGYARLLNPFRRPFRTRDGWLGVVPYTDAQWQRFFVVAGRPETMQDPRYATLTARSRHFPEMYAVVEAVLATRTTAEWCAALADADIPFAPVQSLDELIDDPHLAATGFWKTVDHPTEGTLRMPGIPVTFSDTPGTVRRHAPGIGEHTEEILKEIGLA